MLLNLLRLNGACCVLLQKVFIQYDKQRTSTLDSFELRSALNSAGETFLLDISLQFACIETFK